MGKWKNTGPNIPIEILNLQRKVPIDLGTFRPFISELPGEVAEASASVFSVALISDRRMTELNRLFRAKNSTTDVLSFPFQPDNMELPVSSVAATKYLGDIVISVEQAARQAAANGLTLENEIKQLILHGLLHLCEYDHETDDGQMNARELELRDRLGI